MDTLFAETEYREKSSEEKGSLKETGRVTGPGFHIFENINLGSITIITRNGEPWFVARELSEILGYTSVNRLLMNIPDINKDETLVMDKDTGSIRTKIIVNEAGVYRALLKSTMPKAEAFRKWLTNAVLPALRRGGPKEDKEIDLKALSMQVGYAEIIANILLLSGIDQRKFITSIVKEATGVDCAKYLNK